MQNDKIHARLCSALDIKTCNIYVTIIELPTVKTVAFVQTDFEKNPNFRLPVAENVDSFVRQIEAAGYPLIVLPGTVKADTMSDKLSKAVVGNYKHGRKISLANLLEVWHGYNLTEVDVRTGGGVWNIIYGSPKNVPKELHDEVTSIYLDYPTNAYELTCKLLTPYSPFKPIATFSGEYPNLLPAIVEIRNYIKPEINNV